MMTDPLQVRQSREQPAEAAGRVAVHHRPPDADGVRLPEGVAQD